MMKKIVFKIYFPTQRPIQKKQKDTKSAFYVCINFAKGTTTVPNNASQKGPQRTLIGAERHIWVILSTPDECPPVQTWDQNCPTEDFLRAAQYFAWKGSLSQRERLISQNVKQIAAAWLSWVRKSPKCPISQFFAFFGFNATKLQATCSARIIAVFVPRKCPNTSGHCRHCGHSNALKGKSTNWQNWVLLTFISWHPSTAYLLI